MQFEINDQTVTLKPAPASTALAAEALLRIKNGEADSDASTVGNVFRLAVIAVGLAWPGLQTNRPASAFKATAEEWLAYAEALEAEFGAIGLTLDDLFAISQDLQAEAKKATERAKNG